MEFKFGELELQFRGKHTFIYNDVLDLSHKIKGDKEWGEEGKESWSWLFKKSKKKLKIFIFTIIIQNYK